VQTMYWQESPARALREGGVPVFRDIDAALAALGRVVDHERLRGGHRVPELPAPATAAEGDGVGDYFGARAVLASEHLRFADAVRVDDAEGAVAAAAELGYPVVLKALGLLHKSDAGGVAIGLADDAELARAVATMGERLSPAGYSVERMVSEPGAIELIAGCVRDSRFGPILLVGLGGLFAEVLRDTAVALAPAVPDEVEALLLQLDGAALLTGARGREPLAVRAAAEAAAALSQVAAEHPEIDELEVNPLLVTSSGAIGLDARVVYSQPR
jgi:acetate---CoA ligase (ADP-forming)